jgi:hypothetical protein
MTRDQGYYIGKKHPITSAGVKMLKRDERDMQWTEHDGVSVLECTNGKETRMNHEALISLRLPSLQFWCDKLNFDSKKVPISASMKEIREGRKACECAIKTVSLEEYQKKTGWTPENPGFELRGRIAIMGYK